MGSNGASEHRRLKVVVIGAGIGGLTVAVGLRQDGHEVTVLEQASEFGEVSDIHALRCRLRGWLTGNLGWCRHENPAQLFQNLAPVGHRPHLHEEDVFKWQSIPAV